MEFPHLSSIANLCSVLSFIANLWDSNHFVLFPRLAVIIKIRCFNHLAGSQSTSTSASKAPLPSLKKLTNSNSSTVKVWRWFSIVSSLIIPMPIKSNVVIRVPLPLHSASRGSFSTEEIAKTTPAGTVPYYHETIGNGDRISSGPGRVDLKRYIMIKELISSLICALSSIKRGHS